MSERTIDDIRRELAAEYPGDDWDDLRRRDCELLLAEIDRPKKIGAVDIFGAAIRPPEITGWVVVEIAGSTLWIAEDAYDRFVAFLRDAKELWQHSIP